MVLHIGGDPLYVSLQHAYNRQLVVRVAESTQQVFITAQGQGVEPQLDFCTSVLELGPCLPVSTEVEAEVTVRNPCSFPIEFYCLELDAQYLEEEKVALFCIIARERESWNERVQARLLDNDTVMQTIISTIKNIIPPVSHEIMPTLTKKSICYYQFLCINHISQI